MQGIEGISLGCSFLDAEYKRVKYLLFSLAYVLTTPIGIGELGIWGQWNELTQSGCRAEQSICFVSHRTF